MALRIIYKKVARCAPSIFKHLPYFCTYNHHYRLYLETWLIGSRRGLNTRPFNMESPALPSKLPCFGGIFGCSILIWTRSHSILSLYTNGLGRESNYETFNPLFRCNSIHLFLAQLSCEIFFLGISIWRFWSVRSCIVFNYI